MGGRRYAVALTVVPVVVAAAFSGSAAQAAGPHVWRVGTFNGVGGQFTSIQDAINAARPGDWILVAPGDYHENGVPSAPQKAGVLITTPNLHLRGMNRNTVIVDGTKAGSQPCDASPLAQSFGASDGSGGTVGRNGIEVYKADGVYVDNLLVCNFLSGSDGHNGNQIWWNGGDGGGQIGLHSLWGSYLTASSSYNYGTDPANHGSTTVPMGQYGIFTSNEGGPGVIDHTYSSNMGDSAYYIGACSDCNMVLNHAHAQNSALGFSGTNAGGRLTIENGEWDNNKTGIGPNTLNNDDWPSPANGACPGGTGSCSVITGNNVHDNNNVDSPSFGIAGSVPPGTGILLSGVENFTVTGNTVTGNKAWGVVVNDFPDTETPPADAVAAGAACRGGTDASTPAQELCYYQAYGNQVSNNTFSNNAGYRNPGNADLAVAALPSAPHNGNCFSGNTDTSGTLSSDPQQIQTVLGTCNVPNQGNLGPSFVQLVCSTPGALSFGPVTPACNEPVVTSYPQPDGVKLMPIPFNQATMPDPCSGVPSNPWCPSVSGTHVKGLVAASTGGGDASVVGLPDTSEIEAAPAAAGLLAAGISLGGVVLLRRRRRGVGR